MGAVNGFKFHGFDLSLPFVAKAHIKIKAPKLSLPCSQLYRDKLGPKCGDSTFPRLRISYRGNKGMEQCFRVSTISFSMEDINREHIEKEQSFSTDYKQEAAIDLKLPRRSLLVTFTCDACGARSQRLINKLAYERGLVYVQCSGCSQYHKLVDNLGLVMEYNLQEESNLDANIDQV